MAKDLITTVNGALGRNIPKIADLGDLHKKIEETKRAQVAIAKTVRTSTNIIFSLDATASRSSLWAQSTQIQGAMFDAVAQVCNHFSTQLVYYRGDRETDGSFVVSPWLSTGHDLHNHMSKAHCMSGCTQIELVFRHAIRAASSKRIDALIFVGDACEEAVPTLVHSAMNLRSLKVPLFMFHDQASSGHGNESVAMAYRQIANAANGEYLPFTLKDMDVMLEYLKGISVASTGNVEQMEKVVKETKTPEGRKLAVRLHNRLLLTR